MSFEVFEENTGVIKYLWTAPPVHKLLKFLKSTPTNFRKRIKTFIKTFGLFSLSFSTTYISNSNLKVQNNSIQSQDKNYIKDYFTQI